MAPLMLIGDAAIKQCTLPLYLEAVLTDVYVSQTA